MPILDDNGKVLGAFGTYFIETRVPLEREINGVTMLSKTAAAVLEGERV